MARKAREFLAALGRQFARRRNYQSAGAFGALTMQPVDKRDEKCGGFAAPGLGANYQIAVVQRDWDGFALDRRRFVVTTVAD